MRVAVAVPCTDRKRGGEVPPGASLRSIGSDLPVAQRVTRWVDLLVQKRAEGGGLRLADLYVGPGWAASTELVSEVSNRFDHSVEAFVISAGLGLQRLDHQGQRWPRYSATFNAAHPDSVVLERGDRGGTSRDWWEALGNDSRLGGGTFSALASTHGGILVVASAPYLRAASSDLAEAARCGLRVVAFAASAPRLGELEDYMVRLDPRARSAVPASDARASADFVAYAARELGEDLLDVAAARSFVERTLEGRTPPRRPRGVASRPEEVRSFIQDALRADIRIRKGPLLRRWRDSGRAFEQKRFGAIYDEVASVIRGEQPDEHEGHRGR